MSNFVHLHNYSDYSIQESICTVDNLIDAAIEAKQPAIALTDKGVMYGVPEFYRKAKKAGIKPIIGCDISVVTNGSMFNKDTNTTKDKNSEDSSHLVLLAKNDIGYRNLIKLVSLGFTEGFTTKPRIGLEILLKHRDGLIALSSGIDGTIATQFCNGNPHRAREVAVKLKEMFGDDFYLEIQEHGKKEDEVFRKDIPELAIELNIKLVATNHIHYIKKEDAIAHNIFLHISDKEAEKDYKELIYGTDQFYFRSTEEMKAIFSNHPEAILNTLEISNKIDDTITFGSSNVLEFPIPKDSEAKNSIEYIQMLAKEGLENRYIDKEITKEIWNRLNYELEVIIELNYTDYFLIVQDYVNAAKDKSILVGPGRGSVVGSLVAYALRITNVNPIQYGFVFESFLNRNKNNMCDIVVDIAEGQQSKVTEYLKEKYGQKSVCKIISFAKYSSKTILEDVGQVLKMPGKLVDIITKHITTIFGRYYSLGKVLTQVDELLWIEKPPMEVYYEEWDEEAQEDIYKSRYVERTKGEIQEPESLSESEKKEIRNLVKYSKVLEDTNRNIATKNVGVILAPSSMSDYVPVSFIDESKEMVSQFNMRELERSTSLVILEFLDLRELSIIRDTIKLVNQNREIKIVVDDIPLDDKKTFELFAKGETTDVFQFQSDGIRTYLKRLRPNNIKELSILHALYRPGSMDFIDSYINRKYGEKDEPSPPKVESPTKSTDFYDIFESMGALINQEYDNSKVPLHPVVEPILRETYGILVYQEQVINLLSKVGGMSLCEADIARRAIGKKDLDEMKKLEKIFIKGSNQINNISENIAMEIFDYIDKFANYSYSKSHAVAYTLISYQMAYLKANYYKEFYDITNNLGE
jgi:DNA polymerase-3 subunit alpha